MKIQNWPRAVIGILMVIGGIAIIVMTYSNVFTMDVNGIIEKIYPIGSYTILAAFLIFIGSKLFLSSIVKKSAT